MLPHKNILFSEIARQTHSLIIAATTPSTVTKTLPQIIEIGYMKCKLKTENVTYIKTCPTTVRQRDTTKKKKTPFKKSQILSNMTSNNIYNNLHHFDNDIIVQYNCSSPPNLLHGAPFAYFPRT